MPKLYIHIGPHKTGSTSFQSKYMENLSALDETGPVYLKTGSVNRTRPHHHLAWHYGANVKNHKLSVSENELKNELESLGKDALISSEEFASNQNAIYKIQKIASQCSFSVHPIIVYRSQGELINSHYCQRVKTLHLSEKFAEYFPRAIKEARYDFERFFGGLYSDFDVIGLKYSHAWVDDLLIALADKEFCTSSFKEKNVSPGARQIEALRILSPSLSKSVWSEKAIESVQKTIQNDSKFWGINETQAISIRDRFDATNIQTGLRFGFKVESCPSKAQSIFDIDAISKESQKEFLENLSIISKSLEDDACQLPMAI